MKLKVKRLSEAAFLPSYSYQGDAGLDLYSTEHLELLPHASALVHTGIAIELPEGFEAQIRPRSGLALKNSITVLNSPGTIDQGYRGEIAVILINHGSVPFQVQTGTRIAQLVAQAIVPIVIEEVENLSFTPRGAEGFSSTTENDNKMT